MVRDKEASPVELVEAAIERIERLDPALNAVCFRRYELALQEARTRPVDAPFSGVPTLIKHLEASAGEPHDRATAVLKAAGAVATEDSVISRKMREAGFISLNLVAKAMASSVRLYDLVARYGGEEFCIVLPDTDTDTATIVAERVRAAVFALAEPHADASHGVVSVSIGVAAVVPTVDSRPDQLIEAADAALYEAKRAGRNRVTSA